MADNADNAFGFRFKRSLLGGSNIGSLTVPVTIAASQAIKVGDALTASSGQAIIAASNSPTILGVAQEAVTTEAGETAEILMIPALPWYVFVAQCSGTLAATNYYVQCDIEGATGVMELNENASVEDVCQIIGLADEPNNALGANAIAECVFVRSGYLGLLETR